MTAPNPEPATTFAFGGKTYTTSELTWREIAFFERESGWSMEDALIEIALAATPGHKIKWSVAVYLLLAILRRHHPDLSPDTVFDMVQDPAVQAVLGAAVGDALPSAEPAQAGEPVGNGSNAAS